jgi:hypothetical protein
MRLDDLDRLAADGAGRAEQGNALLHALSVRTRRELLTQ